MLKRFGSAMPIKLEYRGFEFVFKKVPTSEELQQRYDEHIAALSARTAAAKQSSIPRADRARPLPMTSLQERFWFMEQAQAGGSALHITHIVWLGGVLNVSALQQALDLVVQRHEILRTSFQREGRDLVQVVHDPMPCPLDTQDVREVYACGGRDGLDPIFEAELNRPFSLTDPPLIRARIFEMSDDERALMVVTHHIAGDGWSLNLLLREVLGAYLALCTEREVVLPDLPIQFGDFATWRRQRRRESDAYDASLKYWREQLHGVDAFDLPMDRPRPSTRSHGGAMHRFDLTPVGASALHEMVASGTATLFEILTTAYLVTLGRLGGQPDVAIGTVSSGRDRAEVENLIGCFINNLVLRADLRGNPTFEEALERVSAAARGAREHEVPFDWVVDEFTETRNMNENPLFRVMLIQDEIPEVRADVAGLQLLGSKPWYPGSHYDMTLFVEASEAAVSFCFRYSTDLFEPETIAEIAVAYQQILETAAWAPQTRFHDFSLVSSAQQQALAQWGEGERAQTDARPIHTIIAETAEAGPERTALVFDGGSWTYANLDRESDRVAHALTEAGVQRGDRVGVSIERSPALIATLLGILKCGAAYVALQPDLPADRLAYMAADAGLSALVASTEGSAAAPWPMPPILAEGLEDRGPFAGPAVTGDDLAYILYTSGTTGYPKGVEVSHRAVSNLVAVLNQRGLFDADSIVLWKTPVGFDVSVSEMFNTLSVGGRLVATAPGDDKDPNKLIARIRAHHVNTLRMVPTALHMLTEFEAFGQCTTLQTVICAGEALTHEIVARFAQRSGAALYNLLGATETCVDTTYAVCSTDDDSAVASVGGPLPNYQTHVLDGSLHRVAQRAPGELYVGGVGLARGYRGMARRTATTFVPNPWAGAGARMYRTQDVVRWRHNGELSYVGRADRQLQVRGIRVELAAIEAHLNQVDGVEQAAVIAMNEANGKAESLVAYVVGSHGTLETAALRLALSAHLPEAVIPSHFVQIDKMPRTASGKINRGELPEPTTMIRRGERVMPDGDTETRIAGIWQAALEIDAIGANENFFEIGGHSLLAVRIQADIQDAFGVHVSVADFMEEPTVAGLAKTVVRLKASNVSASDLAALIAEIRGE